jgi:CcmD family protein
MDPGMIFLFVGFTAIWLVIGGYVLHLNRRVRELGEEIERLSGQSRSEGESA